MTMFDPVELARSAIHTYLSTGNLPAVPKDTPGEFLRPGGAFVSLKSAEGLLRGCIGTFSPTRPYLAEEIIHNAVGAAVRDPRFRPLSLEEFDSLKFSVDVLEPPEPVADENDLDPKVFGLILRAGARVGLLLPDLEGVDTVADQIDITKRKAGIGPDERAQMQRFRVTRYR